MTTKHLDKSGLVMCHWPMYIKTSYKLTHPDTITVEVGLTSEFLLNFVKLPC